jgi:hypothetical protein
LLINLNPKFIMRNEKVINAVVTRNRKKITRKYKIVKDGSTYDLFVYSPDSFFTEWRLIARNISSYNNIKNLIRADYAIGKESITIN